MKCIITYLAIIIQLTLSCCNNPNNHKQTTNEWLGQHIELPDTISDIRTKQPIILKGSQYTILSYIDNYGCVSCNMKLPLWADYINHLKSTSDKKVTVIILVNSQNIEEARNTIDYYNYKFSVCIDWHDSINTRNKFPSKFKYQTFLLDSLHNVVFIGNPLTNPKIREIYNKHINT